MWIVSGFITQVGGKVSVIACGFLCLAQPRILFKDMLLWMSLICFVSFDWLYAQFSPKRFWRRGIKIQGGWKGREPRLKGEKTSKEHLSYLQALYLQAFCFEKLSLPGSSHVIHFCCCCSILCVCVCVVFMRKCIGKIAVLCVHFNHTCWPCSGHHRLGQNGDSKMFGLHLWLPESDKY